MTRRFETAAALVVVALLAAGGLTLALPGSDGAAPAPARQQRVADRAHAAYDRMGARQRVGQLFMVGVDARGASTTERRTISRLRLGNVFLRGRSDAGSRRTARVTDRLARRAAWRGVAPLVAVDQEGGLVQTLSGPGFAAMPAGGVQGRLRPGVLRERAATWGRQLARAGVNLDLAPVADVVPRSVGRSNAPVGRYLRELGHRPQPVAEDVRAFVRGMGDAGVASTLKHFPGLGRASGDTDSRSGVTAPTRRDSAGLRPFRDGVRAGAVAVMVSSARYPHLDADRLACYSPVVMRTLLRHDLGFDGIVVSDSFSTPALARRSPGSRAVRFLSAGGTMVLDTDPQELRPMLAAVLDRADADPAFAHVVRRAVLRVLEVKAARGLVAP